MPSYTVQERKNKIRVPDIQSPRDGDADVYSQPRFDEVLLQGGATTNQERSLLKSGEFSEMDNLRNRLPGLRQREGSVGKLSSAYSTNTPVTIYDFSKTKVDEDYIFTQWDNSVLMQLDWANETQRLIKTNTANQIPGSWSKANDLLVHSNGVDQHQIFAGGLWKGAELCPDPTCATDFFDTKGTDWTHDAGNDEYDCDAPGADSDLTETTMIESGKTYLVRIEVKNFTAGTLQPVLGTTTGTARGADGIYTEEIVSNGTSFILRANSAFVGSVTGIYVKELDDSKKGNFVSGFVVFDYTGADPGRVISEGGKDYSVEVSDPYNPDVGTIGNLKDWVGGINEWDALFIRTPVPANSFYFDIATANTAASQCTIQYMKSDNTWADVAGQGDFTKTTTGTLAADGFMVWDHPTDEIPSYMFGYSGFWYRLKFSVDLTNTPTVNSCYYGSDFNDIVNVWDGDPVYAIEAKRRDQTLTKIFNYDSTTIGLGDFGTSTDDGTAFADDSDAVFVNFTDPVEGIYIDVSETPNDTGANIYVYYWTGTAWSPLTINDGTDGMSKSGWVTFPRQESFPRQLENALYYSYWYAITTDSLCPTTGGGDDYNMYVAIRGMPYFDIAQFGVSLASSPWKDRICYSFDRWPSYVYVSKQGQPLMLNGPDYGILQAGDGRMNRSLCIRKFVNEIMVWQEETGEEGGCVTIFEGYNPATYGRLLLSSKIGIVNSKAAVVVDGVITATRTDERIQTVAYWVSRYGIMASDGREVYPISDPIGNYFESTEPTTCITKGAEEEHWIVHDSQDNVLRIGLATGGTTTCNVFPVFDIATRTWSFDTYAGKQISCMTEIEAPSGDIPVLQVGGGYSSGQIYQMNTGNSDEAVSAVSTITCVADVAGSLNSTYFTFSTLLIDYYVWMNVNAAGVDPAVSNSTGVEVSLATGATNSQVATAVANAVNALSGVTGGAAVAVATITIGTIGAVKAPAAGTSGFTPSVTNSGGKTITSNLRIEFNQSGYELLLREMQFRVKSTDLSRDIKISTKGDMAAVTTDATYDMLKVDSNESVRHRVSMNVSGQNASIIFKNDNPGIQMYLLDAGIRQAVKVWH